MIDCKPAASAAVNSLGSLRPAIIWWQHALDDGSLRLGRFNREFRADNFGAVAHDPQTHAVFSPALFMELSRGFVKHADAIVFDGEIKAAIPLEANAHGLGPSMFNGVMDSFLGDEV